MAETLYKLKSGKVVRVPNAEIEKNMKFLKLTRSEAVQLWLEDNGYEHNAEQEALTQKAKDSGIMNSIHKAKRADYTPKTQKERVRKEDPTKEGIISAIAELLPSLSATDVNIENKTKVVTFKLGEDEYKIDLSRKRPPKADKGKA